MSNTWRLEIEARLFVFSVLGEMKQSGQLAQAIADQPRLIADLLHRHPLERWHEQGLITQDQVRSWITQALALLIAESECGDSLI